MKVLRAIRLLLLLPLFTLPLHAAPPALSGVVVDEAGVPLAGTEVVAVEAGSLWQLASARTDALGRFQIAVERCGQVVLKASRRDFAPASLNVETCQDSPAYRIILRTGVTASGRIVAADGRPVEGAWAALVRSDASLRDPKEPDPDSARTGPDGRFTLPGVLSGVYELHVAHPEHPRLRQPGIEVPEGRAVDLGGFFLDKPERFEGTVVDPEGRPVEGVRIISAFSDRLAIAAAPVTGPDGRFALPEVIAGRLRLCKEGYAPSGRPLLIHPGLFSKPVRIVAWPAQPPLPLRVTGRVVDDEGHPVAGARVRGGPPQNGHVTISSIDPCTGRLRLFPGQVVTSGADGRFSMEIREGNELDVTAEAPGHLPAAQSRVPVGPARSVGVELVLRRSPVLTGQVLAQDGSPAAGVRVAEFQSLGGQEAVTDAQGRFRLEEVYPGRHVFEARHPELGRALRRLEVSSGANALDFRLDGIPERAVAGRVLDPDGKPLPGANVSIGGFPPTWSAADGRFRLVLEPDWNPPAPALRVLHAGYASVSLAFRVSETPLKGLEIRLGPGQSVAGRLLGLEEPEDLTNVTVTAERRTEHHEAKATREGRYRLGGLGPGEWTVSAHVLGRRLAQARAILEPGQEKVRLDLAIPRHLEVHGRVLEPDGTPAANAEVRFAGSGENGSHSTSTQADADGRFSIDLPSGTYSLLAVRARYAPTRWGPVTLQEPLDGLEIHLLPGWTLTGRVPNLPAETRASIKAEQDGVYRSTEAGPDGAYRFDGLGPGEWKLTATVFAEDFYRAGKGSVTLSRETGGRFDFDLALGDASLSGRLGSDDAPVAASLELLSPNGDEVASTYIDPLDGKFRLPHLRPGAYLLRITDRISGRVLSRNVEVSGNQEIEIGLESEKKGLQGQ